MGWQRVDTTAHTHMHSRFRHHKAWPPALQAWGKGGSLPRLLALQRNSPVVTWGRAPPRNPPPKPNSKASSLTWKPSPPGLGYDCEKSPHLSPSLPCS